MTRMDPEFQPDTKNALEDTKRGYGLWCGEVIHPANKEAVERARTSDQPITDTKGLGFRYVAVWPEDGTPHFRIHEPDRYTKAVTLAASTVHDRVVALVHGLLYREGYEGLKSVCFSTDIPDTPFEFESVLCETDRVTDSGRYRPDITIIPKSKNYPVIELEVVYTHEPSEVRIARAKSVDALVLVCNIRGSVEHKIFDASADMNFTDSDLLAIVKRHRFRWPRLAGSKSPALVLWQDLDQLLYAKNLQAQMVPVLRQVRNLRADAERLKAEMEEGRLPRGVLRGDAERLKRLILGTDVPWAVERFVEEYARATIDTSSELGGAISALRESCCAVAEMLIDTNRIASSVLARIPPPSPPRHTAPATKKTYAFRVAPTIHEPWESEDSFSRFGLVALRLACENVVSAGNRIPHNVPSSGSLAAKAWISAFDSKMASLEQYVKEVESAAKSLPPDESADLVDLAQLVVAEWGPKIDAVVARVEGLRKVTR